MDFNLSKITNIHFIGIDGIGMSALVQYFLAEGKKVSGSDVKRTQVTDLLEKKGVKVFLNQNPENIGKDVNLAVYSVAVSEDNPEIKEVRKRKILTLSYPEVLGLISKDKYTIAVSGTHGKTTTTAMIAKVMIDAGFSPTVIAGSIMNDYKSNFVEGKSPDVAKRHRGSSISKANRDNYFIVEACEYRRSFLHLEPNVLVITNIEEEHLDYYKNLEDIQNGFLELAKKLGKDDFLVCNIEDPNLEAIIGSKEIECNIIDYHSIKSSKPRLKVPGKHNEENAKAALAVSAIFEINSDKAVSSLENFKGTWRRLEEKGKTQKGALIFDDYAHHPTEIKASLSSLKELFPDKKIIAVFQPHLFSRTKILFNDFGESFSLAQVVILLPIYSGRENPDPKINSQKLYQKMREAGKSVSFFESFEKAAGYLKDNFDSDCIIVTMGAGDVYKVSDLVVNN